MKRNEIIQKLINEGFSEKTLVNFTDKQLSSLAQRMLNEETVMISKNSPTFQKDMETAKKAKKTIETYEQKEICEKCGKKVCECKKSEVKEGEKWIQKAIHTSKKGSLKKALGVKKDETIPVSKLKSATKKSGKFGQKARLALTLHKLNEFSETQEWVENIVENNYHSLTTKNEIMELIKTKLTESDVMEQQPSTKPSPSTTPAPTVDPSRPKPQKPKRENPFEPGRQPKPKAKIPEFMKFDNIGIKLKDSK